MSGGVLPALGVQPLLGRVFTQEEDNQHQQLAVLSYSAWQSRFNGDASILGKKILLDRKPYAVIGVMPCNFEFPLVPGHLNRSELWVPISFTPQLHTVTGRPYRVVVVNGNQAKVLTTHSAKVIADIH
jgi:hypothetical protein